MLLGALMRFMVLLAVCNLVTRLIWNDELRSDLNGWSEQLIWISRTHLMLLSRGKVGLTDITAICAHAFSLAFSRLQDEAPVHLQVHLQVRSNIRGCDSTMYWIHNVSLNIAVSKVLDQKNLRTLLSRSHWYNLLWCMFFLTKVNYWKLIICFEAKSLVRRDRMPVERDQASLSWAHRGTGESIRWGLLTFSPLIEHRLFHSVHQYDIIML